MYYFLGLFYPVTHTIFMYSLFYYLKVKIRDANEHPEQFDTIILIIYIKYRLSTDMTILKVIHPDQ